MSQKMDGSFVYDNDLGFDLYFEVDMFSPGSWFFSYCTNSLDCELTKCLNLPWLLNTFLNVTVW